MTALFFSFPCNVGDYGLFQRMRSRSRFDMAQVMGILRLMIYCLRGMKTWRSQRKVVLCAQSRFCEAGMGM